MEKTGIKASKHFEVFFLIIQGATWCIPKEKGLLAIVGEQISILA